LGELGESGGIHYIPNIPFTHLSGLTSYQPENGENDQINPQASAAPIAAEQL
jgi:hypothetical protein